jgi:agmatinase
MVELCPNKNEKSSDFLAAKLFYKMLSYKFIAKNVSDENTEINTKENSFSKLAKFKNDEDEY